MCRLFQRDGAVGGIFHFPDIYPFFLIGGSVKPTSGVEDHIILAVQSTEAVVMAAAGVFLVGFDDGILRRLGPGALDAGGGENTGAVEPFGFAGAPGGIPLEVDAMALEDALAFHTHMIPLTGIAGLADQLGFGGGAGHAVQFADHQQGIPRRCHG